MIKSTKRKIVLGLILLMTIIYLSVCFWDIAKYLSFPLLIGVFLICRKFKSNAEVVFASWVFYSILGCNISIWVFMVSNLFELFLLTLAIIFVLLILLSENRDFISVIPFVGLFYASTTFIILEFPILYFLLILFAIPIIWFVLTYLTSEKEEFGESFMFLFILSQFLVLGIGVSQIRNSLVEEVPKELSAKEKEINNIISLEENQIEEMVETYFDSLKQLEQIAESVNPIFTLKNSVRKNKRHLTAEYSYYIEDVDKKLVEEVTDYKPGKYHTFDSPGAMAILQGVKQSINGFLKQNLERGEKIQIELHGFSDALKYNEEKPTYYNGQEGTFPKNTEEHGEEVLFHKLNGIEEEINLKKNDPMSNPILAFLRAYCMKNEYLKHLLPLRKVEHKTQYTYHSTTQEFNSNVGPEFRKVKIVIDIINPGHLPLVEREIVKRGCDPFSKLILAVFTIILGSFAFFHYKRIMKKSDKRKSILKDVLFFLFLIALAFLLAYWYWLSCPYSFEF